MGHAFSLAAEPEISASAPPLGQQPSALLCGQSRAICYSGFRRGQHPDRGDGAINPSEAEILEDLKILTNQGFRLIRLYDSQVNSATVLRVIKANQLDLKVLLGAWLDAEMKNPNCQWQTVPVTEELITANQAKNREEIQRLIRLAKEYPHIVAAVAIGNEALVDWNDHMVPVESVIRYVREVKHAVSQPVTVADNYDWWAKKGAGLAEELDFISIHIYPIWENKDIGDAIAYGEANLKSIRKALPHRQIVITEAGWATVSSEFGSRASEEKQKEYCDALLEWSKKLNITTFLFEAFDEEWKGNPHDPLGAEKHWGLYTVNRKPKQVMRR